MTKQIICIACPIGCRISVKGDGHELEISGNRCSRGEEYAREEILSPKRVVTTTVRLNSKVVARLPVKTDRPLQSEIIGELLRELYELVVVPPVAIGEVMLSDFRNTGVNVVATRTVPGTVDR